MSVPQYHTVKSGDTLYSIALDRGVDYRELASLNGITDPSRIQLGQQLRLPEPAKGAVTAPLSMPGGVTGTPIAKPIGNTAVLKTGPKGTKVPYTDEAWSKLSGTQVAKADPAPPATGFPLPKTDVPPSTSASPTQAAVESGVEWGWPTRGRMIAGFSDATKGLEIGGNSGQAVVASAAGRVVYAGSGLPRYGKLVIIKHNDVYLSVYAHNRSILVKEGQSVAKGQKIAEMGDTDADQVKLHFEIRRYGKPVDPAQYLSGDLPS